LGSVRLAQNVEEMASGIESASLEIFDNCETVCNITYLCCFRPDCHYAVGVPC
jgi:hypothetical protein